MKTLRKILCLCVVNAQFMDNPQATGLVIISSVWVISMVAVNVLSEPIDLKKYGY